MRPDQYKWDGNTQDERESELRDLSTLSPRDSGYTALGATARRARKRQRKRLTRLMLAAGVLLALFAYYLLRHGRG